MDALPSELEGPRLLLLGIGGAAITILSEVSEDAPCRKVVVDTDAYSLALAGSGEQIDIGLSGLTPRGTGGNPELGRTAALVHRRGLEEALEGDILLLVAGLGGGTGGGAAPVIAQWARDRGVPVLAFLVWPFQEEGTGGLAEEAARRLQTLSTGYLILDNDAGLLSGSRGRQEALWAVNAMMVQTVEGLLHQVMGAFPFALQDEIRDYLEELPTANDPLPLRSLEHSLPLEERDPVAMDPRGRIDVQ